MTNSYFDLIDQTFAFPQEEFSLQKEYLLFNGISLKKLIDTYGTPLKLSYLPKISQQIQKARKLFDNAISEHDYKGKYYYCYCTKSSHFRFVLDEVTKNNVHLETSSAFDIDVIRTLFTNGRINKQTIIVNNGFKTKDYINKICQLINDGYENTIPVLDNRREIEGYEQFITQESAKIGIRVATDEEPSFAFYTSRLGIPSKDVIPFYKSRIANNPKFKLRMLHFFVDKGIRDTIYYWNEFKKCIKTYCELKKICPELDIINIGGGLPIKLSLGFEYDYQYMVSEIVRLIKEACEEVDIPMPNIFTEFGSFTVGESGATIFSVIGQKQQNDAELWYMLDNSIMTTLPDAWGIEQRFIVLPINKWNNEYTRINIGGITCDNSDYYNSDAHIAQIYLPRFSGQSKEPLYIGFFHTGAYQESISGYGGIKHCLIPSPKHIIVTKDEAGNFIHYQEHPEQTAADMLSMLGY